MSRYQRGAGLLELLIALAIGSVVVAGVVVIYIQAARAFHYQHALADMQERGRFATRLISGELRQAGYWGRTLSPSAVDTGGSHVVTPDNALQPVWAGTFRQAQAAGLVPDGATLDTLDSSALPAEALVVRYVRRDHQRGICFDEAGAGIVLTPGVECDDRYYAAIYYLRDVEDDVARGDVPALYMRLLGSGGRWANSTEILRNVESLSIEWGVDTDSDGAANRFQATGAINEDWHHVVSARLYLVVRSAPMRFATSPAHLLIAGTQYTLDDGRLHRLFVTTATLRNSRNRLRTGS